MLAATWDSEAISPISIRLGNAITLSKRPLETDPGTTATTFSKAMENQIVTEHRTKFPRPEQATDLFRPRSETTLPLPPGFVEQVAHRRNFWNSVRTRKQPVEDAVFGLRAAGPALMSNVSYFERRMVRWDPVNMRMLS